MYSEYLGKEHTQKWNTGNTLWKHFVLKSLAAQFKNQTCKNETFKKLYDSKALSLNKHLLVETEYIPSMFLITIYL